MSDFPNRIADDYHKQCLTPIIRKLALTTRFTDEQLTDLFAKFTRAICDVGDVEAGLMPKMEDTIDALLEEVDE